ncbi:MAG: dihydroorotate dehydrogenase electron transfer subunit [Candidatus Sericytochromatia bacterium]|nr:dihydroorotate dehydrogenase electron transfer subunit [Candidatus Tanganyikabacteria bacterium]
MTCMTARPARLERGVLVGQSRFSADLLAMEVAAPEIAATALPGQFVHLAVGAGMLRRPFSVYRAGDGRIELLYRIKGAGTSRMAAWQPGAEVDLLGPLGVGFTAARPGERLLLVGGGIGVAPLAFFAEANPGAGAAILGYRPTDREAGAERFAAAGYRVVTTTELVTGPLEAYGEPVDRVLTCGPWALMKAVAEFSSRRALPCEAALEREMGCGIGACLGCVVETTDPARPYARVCTEGPVMEAGGVKWST